MTLGDRISYYRQLAQCSIQLWLLGACDAVQFHRCIQYCVYDPAIFVRPGAMGLEDLHVRKRRFSVGMGSVKHARTHLLFRLHHQTASVNCCVLHGAIFLGSQLLSTRLVLPLCVQLLRSALPSTLAAPAATALQTLWQVLWLAPAYGVSLAVSSLWYAGLAQAVASAHDRLQLQQSADRQGKVLVAWPRGFRARGGDGAAATQAGRGREPPSARAPSPAFRSQPSSPLLALSRQAYRLALLAVALAAVSALSLVPRAGAALSFPALAWLQAFYCFDYRWAQKNVSLEARLAAFQRHWVYMAGFGAVTALPALCLPYYAGAAWIGLLFPAWIICAADARPHASQERVLRRWPAEVAGALGGEGVAILQPVVALTNALIWAGGRALRRLGGR